MGNHCTLGPPSKHLPIDTDEFEIEVLGDFEFEEKVEKYEGEYKDETQDGNGCLCLISDVDDGTHRHDGGRWGFVLEGMHENLTFKV